ncbi:hypothetical protein D4R78_04390 [bacterium]|nr:MAG: hypothetical protein D4R78_04390 [bacterium]
MSIIYEALRKVSAAQGSQPQAKPKSAIFKKNRFKSYLFYVLVICFGFFFANIFFNVLVDRSVPNPKAKILIQQPNREKIVLPVSQSPAPLSSIGSEQAPAVLKDDARVPLLESKSLQQEDLVLSGVFFSEEEGFALINNQIVKVGDLVSGATVKQIGFDGVELTVGDRVIKLDNRD